MTQGEIEEQKQLGEASLLEEDHWMMEVNLDQETSSGAQEAYWLMDIKTTQKAAILKRQQPAQHSRKDSQVKGVDS